MFTELTNRKGGSRVRPCLPPLVKHPFPSKGNTDMPTERDYLVFRGMEKIHQFINRAAPSVKAKFPRKRRDLTGKVLEVYFV
jgi:hypothetical protein